MARPTFVPSAQTWNKVISTTRFKTPCYLVKKGHDFLITSYQIWVHFMYTNCKTEEKMIQKTFAWSMQNMNQIHVIMYCHGL